jgi:hypothetical protein
MGEIIFNRQSGGLGRPLDGTDHYSGLIFYSDDLPAGFTVNERIKKIFSVREAEDLGIVNDFSDETKPTSGGTILITTAGAEGNINSIYVSGGLLGSYTVASGDAVGDVATGLAAAINARTFRTGWSATIDTATVTLIPPTGLGALNNSANITFTSSGTGAATVGQFAGGVSSVLAILHYNISEFFRMQPKGVLWVGIFAEKTYDGVEVKTMQDYAEGAIKQLGVFLQDEVITGTHVTASQAYADILETENRPLSVILSADFTGKTIATLANLATLDSERVSVILGMDGNWNYPAYSNTQNYIIGDKVNFQGATFVCKSTTLGNSPFEGTFWTRISTNLSAITAKTITAMGAALGTVAFASVHENIGWVGVFNVANGNILDEAGLATGVNFKDLSVSQVETLNAQKYIFLRKYDDVAGTRWNDSWTCTLSSSDFATIENVRTLDKATRLVRIFETPLINSPLYVDANGKLSFATISVFQNEASRALEQMETAEEISAFKVLIDPNQNVLQTSKVVISIEIIPVGVARTIVNNIGFVVQLSK